MSTPKPEVLYLPAIFREIRQGRTRVPAFQRGFVWNQNQILELLESIYKSYPIGSLLFWNIDVSEMRTDSSEESPLPHPEVQGTVDFILDGMQRITSLYGAFHSDQRLSNDIFDIVFDLKEQLFKHRAYANSQCISLRVILTPKDLLAEQARLGALPNGDLLIERTLELQRAFQEYLIPVVRIGQRSPSEVVEIFERINNTGTRLDAVDFMRALTWSDSFDLSDALDNLAGIAANEGYEVPLDTLAKLIALFLDIVPTGSEMLKLRGIDPSRLQEAAKQCESSLKCALGFLARELHFLGYDYLPYEGQFLIISSLAESVGSDFPKWLLPWIWSVSFSESMQGRPDTTIARMALSIKKNPAIPLRENLTLAPDDLTSRIVRKGAALSMAIVSAMATRPACSVLTGHEISITETMVGFGPDLLAPIFSKRDLEEAGVSPSSGARLIANVVILDTSERRPRPNPKMLQAGILNLAEQEAGLDLLDTQCIDKRCVEAIKNADVISFLGFRADQMYKLAGRLSKDNL